MMSQKPPHLLRQRRFLPYFLTQLWGAFNDNIYKNALLILIAFQFSQGDVAQSHVLINLSAALFILPFFLFSAIFGQWADKYEKSALIRRVKLLEIAIMVLAAIGFYLQHVGLLMTVLFLMGTQSALFGPLKYSFLPQHLSPQELTAGNGLVQMGTFLAILLGTLLGGILLKVGITWVAITVITIAIIGYLSSLGIPYSPPTDANLTLSWHPLRESWRLIQLTRQKRRVFLPILGISWFWFYGATYLTQLPNYTRLVLGGDETVVSLLLTLFSLGIGVGSLLCNKLSDGRIEPGLVPFGALGLSVFGFSLFLLHPTHTPMPETLLSAFEFAASGTGWWVMSQIVLLGLFGGFYIVPLQAMLQQRSEPSQRARIIAGGNIFSALFMVLSAVMSITLLQVGLSIPQLFLVLALMNMAIAVYIHGLAPEFLMRFLVWLLIHTIYKVRKQGLQHIPEKGAAVLVCNHVSFVDAIIIVGCINRPVRFVMDHRIYNMPVVNFIFRTAKAIPIASYRDDPALLEQAYTQISACLEKDEVLMIFPEGKITRDGHINVFRAGIEKIIKANPVPVIPMALCGLWGSYFSRRGGAAMSGFPKKIFFRIDLRIESPIPAQQVSAADLQQRVQRLRGDWR